mmetsp:Transcript_25713/g.65351  ORF Transcript_25713/g.65351 Transcript_25713/m.65351 type:complete len:206 (+) Transcript_25713:272-889(+)
MAESCLKFAMRIDDVRRGSSGGRDPVARVELLNAKAPLRQRLAVNSHGGELDLLTLRALPRLAQLEVTPLKLKAKSVAAALGVRLLEAPESPKVVLHLGHIRSCSLDDGLLRDGKLILHHPKRLLEVPPPATASLLGRGHVHASDQPGFGREHHKSSLVRHVEVEVGGISHSRWLVGHERLTAFRSLNGNVVIGQARRLVADTPL